MRNVRTLLIIEAFCLLLLSGIHGFADAQEYRAELKRETIRIFKSEDSSRPFLRRRCEIEKVDAAGRHGLCATAVDRRLGKSIEITARLDEDRGALILRGHKSIRDGKTTYLACEVSGDLANGSFTCKTPDRSSSERKGLVSPFPSRVDGFGLPNASWIGEFLLRGMNPQLDQDYQDLAYLEVQRVLIFKAFHSDTAEDALQEELDHLQEIVWKGDDPGGRVKHIPFAYHGFPDFKTPCLQTISGLQWLRDSTDQGQKTFFHCTVGEDRTGYLAGLYRLMEDPELDLEELFRGEMCENGYGAGNPQKPFRPVVMHIREDLTPLFKQMAFLIKAGKLTLDKLDPKVCDQEVSLPASWGWKLQCQTSTYFMPGMR